MGHGKHITGGAAAPEPVADYNVAINPGLVPDCSCNYFAAGTYNGKNYYQRVPGTFFIWWKQDTTDWILSVLPGSWASCWRRHGAVITGQYTPFGSYLGVAIVSAGPH